ncbi:MAG: hypothetical protein HY753_01305 [Nitrospirae bacterium]|nr:hypothetical protein [Nitrospirota bacterium]
MAFENGSWFVSASSKRLGIDYDEFERLIIRDRTTNIPGIGKRFELNNENILTLVADGYPINFFNSESVPDRSIEFIPTLLFKSAEFIVDNIANLEHGIINIDNNDNLKKISDDIAEIFYLHRDS